MKEMTKKGIFINFNESYLKNKDDVLNSSLFSDVLLRFINMLDRKKISYYKKLSESFSSKDEFLKGVVNIFKMCLLFPFESFDSPFKEHKDEFITFIEEFYNYYRKFERYSYTIVQSDTVKETQNFLDRDQYYNNLILNVYRTISENVRGNHYLVYRQLNAGSNAGFILEENKIHLKWKYEKLNVVRTVDSIVLHPPFIVYPKNTKRSGIFRECPVNPITYLDEKDLENYICYPIYIGRFKAYVYFNIEYASLGVSLANLFTPIATKDLVEKPDIILMYGVNNKDLNEPFYYHDKEEDIFVGITPNNDEMTYFGYLKKILLTLHNIKCIERGEIPLHGAMVSITLVNGKTTNVVLIGDSGAGKSETLESLKNIMDDDISEMITVFDDMGTMNKDLVCFGTETGAFVRMDDLDIGYAYHEIDRAIFMNPDRKNARTIIPITPLSEVVKGHRVDMVLYANNYEEKDGIHLFNNKEEALEVFKAGKRRAKGTTSETGLVSSYFANPFGPVQKQDLMEPLLDEIFGKLFDKKILVGEIYTKLGTKDAKEGVIKAAEDLIEFIR